MRGEHRRVVDRVPGLVDHPVDAAVLPPLLHRPDTQHLVRFPSKQNESTQGFLRTRKRKRHGEVGDEGGWGEVGNEVVGGGLRREVEDPLRHLRRRETHPDRRHHLNDVFCLSWT